jgi:shikimate kinase
MIHLVGPGGAGKTTIGAALAERLDVQFVDLDTQFTARYGDITDHLNHHGYGDYASRNVNLYAALIDDFCSVGVLALSSGFMTYQNDVHPSYASWRLKIASSNSTFILLPSLDEEICVKETVRRQLGRPFARTPQREEQVIRERFSVYIKLPAIKIETMKPVDCVVADILSRGLTNRSTRTLPL